MGIGRLFALSSFALLIAGAAQAQNPVHWTLGSDAKADIKPADRIEARLTARIDNGWHLYSLTQGPGGPVPTRIYVPDGTIFQLGGQPEGSAPHVAMDPSFGINTETYDADTVFRIPLVAGKGVTSASPIAVNVRYQTCNSTMCLPPRTARLSAVLGTDATSLLQTPSALTAAPTAGLPAIAPSTPAQPASTPAANPRGSLWSFVWLAMSVGAVSLLTPCVFPMVPITVSYFTKHAAGNRATAVRDAFIYALGIILTFTAVGVILAILFGAAGINKFASSPWVNLAITAIFVLFALSLFGAIELQIPPSILERIDSFSRSRESSKIAGLLLMGLTFSLTSFTCTAPFVGTLLVTAAAGDWMYPVIGMLAFSSVFSLPFFVLALAPQLVAQLPKSGGWLNSVKVAMGLLEIAAAMKFLSNADLVWRWGIFTREVVLASWLAVSLLLSLYLLGKFQLTNDSPTPRIGAVRLLSALVSLSVGFYLLTGLFGARSGELEPFLPPASTDGTGTVATSLHGNRGGLSDELSWIQNDYDGALAKARETNTPVFIDFTGYTCTNCRWMEANMFNKAPVRQQLSKFVRVRLYTDGEGVVYEKQQAMQQSRFGTVALPLYAVVDSSGKIVEQFPGLTRSEPEFTGFLHSAQNKFANDASLTSALNNAH